MNIEELRNYCLSIKGATESFPFDKTTLVFKVMDKMFAYINLEPKDGLFRVDMKCAPGKSAELREKYTSITHGTHTRELMWNSVYLSGDAPDSLIKELIIHSAEEVINKLPKNKQAEYKELK